jgi:hypothetical protein
MRRAVFCFGCVLALSALTACATEQSTRGVPRADPHAELGTIGVVSQTTAQVRTHDTLYATPPNRQPLFGPEPVITLLAIPVFALGRGLGIVKGGSPIPENTIQQIDATAINVVAQIEPETRLRELIRRYAAEMGSTTLIDLGSGGVADPNLALDYSSFAAGRVQTVLEVGVYSVGFVGRGGSNPDLRLQISGWARLVRVSDNQPTWVSGLISSIPETHTFSEWTTTDTVLVKQSINRQLQELARTIAESGLTRD